MANFAIGKTFTIHHQDVSVVLGGGLTRYLSLFPGGVEGYVEIGENDSYQRVFEYEMSGADKRVKGFLEGSVQTKLGSRFLIGIKYRYHFKPALTGTYRFYHTNDPVNGTLSVTQRAVSILFAVRIGKRLPE